MFIPIFLLFSTPAIAISFGLAKAKLADLVYGHKNKTFYCGCRYQAKSIDSKSCKILTKRYKKRKYRLEWEHVVPAHAFGQSFREWREAKAICKKNSPRKCARKMNATFKAMEGDPVNLVPAVGSVNAVRSNYSFAEFKQGEELCLGGLRISGRKVMPPPEKKGDIARIYFYMDKTYPGRGVISNKNKKLFESWSRLDPVDQRECERNLKILKATGFANSFVLGDCKK